MLPKSITSAVQSLSHLYIGVLLLLLEAILNVLIIKYVPYTEIDWKAYMQEVAGVIESGIYDYKELRGDTGPLVYPAGFVYIYSLLYWITDKGTDIRTAQYIFAVLYLISICILFYIYSKTKVPPLLLTLICLSRRVHSIFVLRLFNDCIAMLFLYLSVALFINKRWNIGCFFFSVAVSIKMNILLFAPGLLLLLLKTFGIIHTIPKLAICAIVQVLLGLPFLLRYPLSYIACAFDLGRQFMYIWSVNWKFFPEHIFLSTPLKIILLAAHVALLLLFVYKFCKHEGGVTSAISGNRNLTPEHIVTVMFICNFIGIVCSRTLHYQFYVWYQGTLPYLLWKTQLPLPLKVIIYAVIEIVWNIFPSNAYTSITLFIAHLILLFSLWTAPLQPPTFQKNEKKDS